MSLKKVEQVKKDKGFKIFDLIAYGVIVALVAVLFIVLFTVGNTEKLTGVRITVASETVFEYEFGKEPSCSESVKAVEDDKGITLTIVTEYGKNVVYIDKLAKSVKMLEADCKGGDCIYFPDMDNNSKFIYCNPHRLKIEPLEKDISSPVIPF